MLEARDLSVEVGGRLTLASATFTVRPGDTVGLVGRNGAGKTSLLRVLAGEAPAHGGTVRHTGGLGYLDQDPRRHVDVSHKRVLDHVLAGRGLDELAERMEKLRLRLEEEPTARNVDRHARAHDEYERQGGYAADAEVRRIVAGLGLDPSRIELSVGVLSGGERRRVELARILFGGSDVLLLDEPTNHLDTDAKQWLMAFLRAYKGALLVVSHDLELLDQAITRVLHVDEGTLVEYRGTYTQYRTSRAADEVRLAKLATAQATEIKRLSTLADSMRGQTVRRARVAKSIDKRVERLATAAVDGPKRERNIAVRLPDPPTSGRVVLEVDGLAKSYGGPRVFEGVGFAVEKGERLMIMGLNGAGKTSLLRILAGVTEADEGEVRLGLNVSTGYYAQEHENIAAGTDLVTHLKGAADRPLGELRGLLGMYGLSGEMAFQDAGTLSGGEKTKLSLAMLTAGQHNLLLLDEPTNNLDPPSRTAVAHALAGWKGSMVLVSHDPEFVRELAPNRVLMMPEGTLDYWSDDLLDLVSMA